MKNEQQPVVTFEYVIPCTLRPASVWQAQNRWTLPNLFRHWSNLGGHKCSLQIYMRPVIKPHENGHIKPHDKTDHDDTTTKRVFGRPEIGGYCQILSDIAHIWADTNILFKGYVLPVIKPHHIHSYSRIDHNWPPHSLRCPFFLPLGHNSWMVCSCWEWHPLLPYCRSLSDLTIGGGSHIEWCKLNSCANIWWTQISYLLAFVNNIHSWFFVVLSYSHHESWLMRTMWSTLYSSGFHWRTLHFNSSLFYGGIQLIVGRHSNYYSILPSYSLLQLIHWTTYILTPSPYSHRLPSHPQIITLSPNFLLMQKLLHCRNMKHSIVRQTVCTYTNPCPVINYVQTLTRVIFCFCTLTAPCC